MTLAIKVVLIGTYASLALIVVLDFLLYFLPGRRP